MRFALLIKNIAFKEEDGMKYARWMFIALLLMLIGAYLHKVFKLRNQVQLKTEKVKSPLNIIKPQSRYLKL